MTNDARTELLIDDLMDRGEHGVPVREIRRVAGSPLWVHRLWAYFAAGAERSAEGNALLLAALESDPELADIVALALAESGDPQAIDPLYRALQRCEPWTSGATAGATEPERVTGTLSWQPPGAAEPLVIDLASVFAPI